MRKSKEVLFWSAVLAAIAASSYSLNGQSRANPTASESYSIPLSIPNSIGARFQVVGQIGNQTRYYWFAPHYGQYTLPVMGPYIFTGAPATLNSSNFIIVNFSSSPMVPMDVYASFSSSPPGTSTSVICADVTASCLDNGIYSAYNAVPVPLPKAWTLAEPAATIPIHDIGGQVFNVLAFGADPTGVSYSNFAYNAALNAAMSVKGGVVLFPPGTYYMNGVLLTTITQPVTLDIQAGATLILQAGISASDVSGVHIEGGGTIQLGGNAYFSAPNINIGDPTGGHIAVSFAGVSNSSITGITFDGNRAHQNGTSFFYAIGIFGGVQDLISGITAKNWMQKGVLISSSGDTTPPSYKSFQIQIRNSVFTDDGTKSINDGGGIGFYNTQSSLPNPGQYQVTGNFFSNDYWPIDILPQGNGQDQIQITGNIFEVGSNTQAGVNLIVVEAAATAQTNIDISHNIFSNVLGSGDACIYQPNGSGVIYEGNDFNCAVGIQITADSGIGGYDQTSNTNIVGNTFQGNTGISLYSQGTGSITNLSIAGNISTATTAVSLDRVSGTMDLKFLENSFESSTTPVNLNGTSGMVVTGGWQIEQGFVTLASGIGTATFVTPFTTASSYACTANDYTATSAIRIVTISASQVTFTASGLGSDVVVYVCRGY